MGAPNSGPKTACYAETDSGLDSLFCGTSLINPYENLPKSPPDDADVSLNPSSVERAWPGLDIDCEFAEVKQEDLLAPNPVVAGSGCQRGAGDPSAACSLGSSMSWPPLVQPAGSGFEARGPQSAATLSGHWQADRTAGPSAGPGLGLSGLGSHSTGHMSAGAVQKLVQGSAVASSAPSALFGHEGCGAMAAGDSIRQRISSWPMSLSSVSSLGSQGRCAYPGGLPSMPELEEPVYHSMTSPEAACTVSHAFAPQPPGGPLPRPASMPALGGKPLKFDPGVQPEAVPRRKGRGGRTAAMDPRLDPNIDPKRAKRILANRLSAARSKNKQRGHLDTLEKSRATLTSQKESLVKEIAWLQSEVRSLEEDGAELQAKLRNLQERALLQEALQIKLLQECGHPALGHGSDYGGATLPMQPY